MAVYQQTNAIIGLDTCQYYSAATICKRETHSEANVITSKIPSARRTLIFQHRRASEERSVTPASRSNDLPPSFGLPRSTPHETIAANSLSYLRWNALYCAMHFASHFSANFHAFLAPPTSKKVIL